MSETVVFETATNTEIGEGLDVLSDSISGESESQAESKQWGEALTALVAANADIIVRCDWMGGVQVTVADAMTNYNYPPNLTAADEPFLMSLVYQLLANRVVEKPEDAEIENQETEEPAETSDQDNKGKADEGNKDKHQLDTKAKTDNRKNLEKPAEIKSGKKLSTEPIVAKSPKFAEISEAKTEKAISPTQAPKIERPAKTRPAEQAAIKNFPAPSVAATNPTLPMVEKKSASSPDQAQAPIIKVDKPSPRPNIVKIPATPKIETVGDAAPHSIEPPAEPKKEKIIEAAPAMDKVELDAFELPVKEIEPISEPNDITEQVVQEITIEDMPELEITESPIGIDPDWLFEPVEIDHYTIELPEEITLDTFEPVTFFERQTADTFEEAFIEPNILPVLELGIEPFEQEQPAAIVPAQSDQMGLVIEQTEEVFLQMAEIIQQSTPELAEAVNKILDKIIEAPAKLAEQTAEAMPIETEVKEELEELFIELFDTAGLDCTPELNATLVYLTVDWNLADEIKKIKTAEPDKTKDRGTHEIIKKFLAAVSTIKKAMANAGTIGRSALRLYSFNLAAINT